LIRLTTLSTIPLFEVGFPLFVDAEGEVPVDGRLLRRWPADWASQWTTA